MSIILQDLNFIQPHHFNLRLSQAITLNQKSNNSLLDTFKHVSHTIKNYSLPILFSQYLERLDTQFLDSTYRKNHYLVKDRRERTLITSFGEITFKRRIYIHNQTGKRYYYIDQLIKIRHYQRVLDELLFKMIEELIEEKTSYQKVVNRYGLSKTTLYNALKNLDLIDFHQLEFKPSLKPFLYIQADEHFVSTQKQTNKKKIMIKQITLFDGIKQECKGRYRLTNRITLTQHYQESNRLFRERVSEVISKIHPYKQESTFVLRGDGAPWIKNLADELGCKFYIDGFHYKQAILTCIPRGSKPIINMLMSYLQHNDFQSFTQVIFALHDVQASSQLSQTIQNNLLYIQRHTQSYFDSLKEGLPGCSAEGQISHYLASQLTRHPKAYNPMIAHTTAALISMSHNGIQLSQFLNQMKPYIFLPSVQEPLSASYFDVNRHQVSSISYKSNINNKPTLEKELMRNYFWR